jgi:hypothetical protein
VEVVRANGIQIAYERVGDMTRPGCSPASLRPSATLLEEMTIAARPASLERQLSMMAEADERDLLPRIAVPTRCRLKRGGRRGLLRSNEAVA